jgi:hypothetical protein
VVAPTREHATAILKAANPNFPPNSLDYLSDAAVISWSLPAQQVERRGAFKRVIVHQADAPALADIELGGYPMDIIRTLLVTALSCVHYGSRTSCGVQLWHQKAGLALIDGLISQMAPRCLQGASWTHLAG